MTFEGEREREKDSLPLAKLRPRSIKMPNSLPTQIAYAFMNTPKSLTFDNKNSYTPSILEMQVLPEKIFRVRLSRQVLSIRPSDSRLAGALCGFCRQREGSFAFWGARWGCPSLALPKAARFLNLLVASPLVIISQARRSGAARLRAAPARSRREVHVEGRRLYHAGKRAWDLWPFTLRTQITYFEA